MIEFKGAVKELEECKEKVKKVKELLEVEGDQMEK